MKFALFILLVLGAVPLWGQSPRKMKKTCDSIMVKMEQKIEKNYYSDSVVPVAHSEYTYIGSDSNKTLVKAVYLEYFPLAFWNVDSKYYADKYGYHRSFPYRYYLTAILYNSQPDAEYGTSGPIGRSFKYADAHLVCHSELGTLIHDNKKRREEAEYRDKDIDVAKNITYSVNKKNYDDGKTTETFWVTDTMYDNTPCYKLKITTHSTSVYGKKERDAFEQKLSTDTECTQEEKDELRYYVEYWAGREVVRTKTYIINKQDYAMLYFFRIEHTSNSQREWFVTEQVSERYTKGSNNKYNQTYYKRWVLNFVKGIGFQNDKGIATWIVQRPLNKSYDLSALKPLFPNKIAFWYEEFCDILPQPSAEMLYEWNEYNSK